MNHRVLIIIPAYNEAENLPTVLNSLKKHIDFADILVINDCSTDNTEEILIKNNTNYITNIFNLGYAMSVQTGIKYANQNNYDYVIQMDSDGQHSAKDAKKLYQTATKTNSDIVIGSRYLTETDYDCPLFRRIGTKIFEFIIKIFCHQKITDPLSGFQCLNKKVIKLYSKSSFYPEYPDANLIMEMIYRGYKITETSVEMQPRLHGESMHGGIIKPIKYMTQMFYAIVLIILQNIRRTEHE